MVTKLSGTSNLSDTLILDGDEDEDLKIESEEVNQDNETESSADDDSLAEFDENNNEFKRPASIKGYKSIIQTLLSNYFPSVDPNGVTLAAYEQLDQLKVDTIQR